MGEFLIERTLSSVAATRSPVSGEPWPALSKDYKARKQEAGRGGKANMEFEGDMLDNLEFRNTADGIKIGVFGKDARKADGHNKLSGKTNNTPQRRFLPDEGQKYKGPINKEIEKIISDGVARDVKVKRSDFADVDSKASLTKTLNSLFPDFTRSEIVGIIGRSDKIQNIFKALQITRFL